MSEMKTFQANVCTKFYKATPVVTVVSRLEKC